MVIGAAAGAIIYEAGTGIYRVGIAHVDVAVEGGAYRLRLPGVLPQQLGQLDADNNKFHPAFPVSKLRTCLTWNAAKEKGLFDKTEE